MDNVNGIHLHVISFDIPYPANYGGVIDVFYKIKELYSAGIKVHLHCFEYGREHAEELKKWCFSVDYYPRKKSIKLLFKTLPYIVASRSCKKLLHNLEKDNFPILYEGLHTTSILHFKNLGDRKQYVRMHNIEHDYYTGLANASSNILKKYYYYSESLKLKKYEKVLEKASAIFAIAEKDYQYFKKNYKHAVLLPAFHANDKVNIKPGRGKYILYHGNLSVEENEKAAQFLIEKVFSQISHPCLIVGKNPSALLTKLISVHKHIKLIPNPDQNEMNEFIKDAQIIVLPTFQPTGIKLKLIDSVFNGRHCLVNEAMVENTGLEEITVIADHADQMIDSINRLMSKSIAQYDIEKREFILKQRFSNHNNIRIITNCF